MEEDEAPSRREAPTAQVQTLGPWTLHGLLGLGLDAAVYAAEGAEGEVALKVARTSAARQVLLREAEQLKRLEHPHLPRLVTTAPDGSWLASELIRGQPADEWAADHSADDIAGVVLELLDALLHLQRNRVIHGDIKPSNVLIDGWGHPKLLDLGGVLAQGARGQRRMTPGFTAPEVLAGGRAGHPADVYGLGATAYAMLTGRAPFDVPDPTALAFLAMSSAPLPPSTWRIDLPVRLDRLVLSMLARDPLQRPELRQVEADLCKLHHTQPQRPVVGMDHARAVLHREVSRAASGEAVVLAIHGPSGSGRRTLGHDALRLARREGMRVVEKAESKSFLEALARDGRPAMMIRARHKDAVELTRRLLRSRTPGLLILWDTRPVPEIDLGGIVHLTPDPLDREATLRIGDWLRVPHDRAVEVWRRTGGHPAATWKALELISPVLDDAQREELPRESKRIIDAVEQAHGVLGVLVLARALQMPPQTLLDECELLVAAGRLAFGADGQTVRLVDP